MLTTNVEKTVAAAKSHSFTDPQSIGFSPFRTLQRVADEVARVFEDFGLSRGWGQAPEPGDVMKWVPRVDVTQHQDEVLVRVDLPGMEKDDIRVNVSDQTVTIHGERHRAEKEERDAVYRSERNFGMFCRIIPLPEGTVTDQAKASFNNGVLEIRIPAVPLVQGRPVEIAG